MEDGESVRNMLRQNGVLDLSHQIGREEGHLLIPIVGTSSGLGYDELDIELSPIPRKETDYRKLLDLPQDLLESLPSSFDVIGDVAILKLEETLIAHAPQIADALMATNQRLRSVALDRGVKGEMRVRDLEPLRGSHDLSSVHTEYGVSMEVDPSLAYFNPRLSRERKRIADLVSDGEVIADMFAGVGPFPLVICKHSSPSHVFAIDLNPQAVAMMRRNILRNRLQDRISAIEGDSKESVRKLPDLDRVIMNLPHMSEEFLFYALYKLRPGGVVHLYKILERDDLVPFQERVLSIAATSGRVVNIEGVQELKTYSPTMSVYCFDLRC